MALPLTLTRSQLPEVRHRSFLFDYSLLHGLLYKARSMACLRLPLPVRLLTISFVAAHCSLQEWDYLFDIDINGAMLRLPFNRGDDPYMAAQQWMWKNDIDQGFLDQALANYSHPKPSQALLAIHRPLLDIDW